MEKGFFTTQPGRGLGVLALVLVCIALVSYAYANFKQTSYLNDIPASITVDGEGEVLAIPDIGQFTFSVRAEAETAEAAQEASGTAMNEILAYLTESGIAETDVKTQNYNLWPQYQFVEQICPVGEFCPPRERVQTGFEVNQSVSVKVRDTDTAGAIIAGIGERGATNISGLDFTIDDIEVLQAEARELAIADAKAKAKVLAEQLGVKITRLVSYYENGGGYYEPQFERSFALSAEASDFGGPSLPTGEESTRSSVSLTFEIK